MKKSLLVLMLLPATIFAQQQEQQKAGKTNGLKICFKRLMPDKCTTVYGPGNWTLDVNGNKMNDSKLPTNINVANQNNITAENVEIASGNFPLLKADKMVFNDLTSQATLTGHITIVDNGTSKELAQTAVIDVYHDTYSILSLK